MSVVCCFSFSTPAGECGGERRSARGIRRSDACLLFRSRTPILSERRGSETRACGAREARGAEKNARPVAKRAPLLGARETPSRSTSKPTRDPPPRRRRGGATCRCCWYTRIRKAKPPPRHALASALWFRTSRLPTVISGRVGSKERDALTQGSNERSRRRRGVPPSGEAVERFSRKVKKRRKDPIRDFSFFFGFNLERIR